MKIYFYMMEVISMFFNTEKIKLYCGNTLDVLKTFRDKSINCCMTSPPYWALRDYGVTEQLGLEPTFQKYITRLCDIFDEVKRVLKKEGTCWVNMGDTYSAAHTGGHKSEKSCMGKKQTTAVEIKQVKDTDLEDKCLCQIPSRFAIEMTNRGWILRNEIIWHKPNCMPSSAKDRFTVDYEKIFFFVKNKKYWFETQYEPHLTFENRPHGAVRNREYGYDSKFNALNKKKYTIRQKRGGDKNPDYRNPKGRNKRCIWKINTKPFKGAHFAVFPEELVKTPILAGCPKGGVVLDPFCGSGTTGVVAYKLNRKFIGIDLNKEYCEIAKKRILKVSSQQKLF